MKRITDPSFKYYPACDTDLQRTFRRARKQIKAKEAEAKLKQQKIIDIKKPKKS